MMRMLFPAIAVLSACFRCGAAVPGDWSGDRELRRGVRLREIHTESPRLMRGYMLRVDLKTPGLAFTATERDPDWGRPMPDYTNEVKLIRTRREKTVDFMKRRRAEGKPVGIAVNTAAWSPFCPPWNHRYADTSPYYLVSDGIEVSSGRQPACGALFVVHKDGRAEITSSVPLSETNDVAFAFCGFGIIATNSVAIGAHDGRRLAPRTAFGLSADRRYLYLLAVDGRQPGYSLGADMGDLCDILIPAGAADAINMDGGGSTSLVVWDAQAGGPRMLNHQPEGAMRTVAFNCGIIFRPPVNRGVFGHWLTYNDDTGELDSRIEIYEKDGEVRGRVVEIFGTEEEKNGRARIPGAPRIVGLDIITGMKRDGDRYSGGKILDPDSGKYYNCRLWRDGANLVMRASVLFLSSEQVWKPAEE